MQGSFLYADDFHRRPQPYYTMLTSLPHFRNTRMALALQHYLAFSPDDSQSLSPRGALPSRHAKQRHHSHLHVQIFNGSTHSEKTSCPRFLLPRPQTTQHARSIHPAPQITKPHLVVDKAVIVPETSSIGATTCRRPIKSRPRRTSILLPLIVGHNATHELKESDMPTPNPLNPLNAKHSIKKMYLFYE